MIDRTTRKNILTTATILMVFAIAGALLVGITFIQTEDDILENERRVLLNQLNTIIPADRYDNDLLHDSITLQPSNLLGTDSETVAYRARMQDSNIAVIFSSIAPNGYNGPIELLVGIYADETIAGVRVVKHRETPGLGDAVSITHSDWILGFDQHSLSNPEAGKWKVKRDGGIFDQFTGATITPRAVVKAVHNALLYFSENKDSLFTRPAEAAADVTAE
jgi:electron transport complex protein RnfG